MARETFHPFQSEQAKAEYEYVYAGMAKAWQVPCLFLVGEHEKIYSPRAALRRLSRVAPLVKAEIVPGTGHDLTLVQPDLVARKVLDFLNEPIAPATHLPEDARPAAGPHGSVRPI